MRSILQKGEPCCYVCGSMRSLERHHVMSGTANRKLSEEHGLWVYLCRDHHTGSIGVHSDIILNQRLKRDAQRAFERTHSHDEWMKIFRKNYL